MSRQNVYYTLIASLPYLPHFEQAERLPISEKRLGERLRMLEPDDREVVRRGFDFLAWRRHPTDRTDEDMLKKYQRFLELLDHPALQSFVGFLIDQRTITVALRRRQRGLPSPAAGEAWGVGQWVRYIEQHWEADDFQLSAVHPWIPEARAFLAQEDVRGFERFRLNLQWQCIERTMQGNSFGFETVLAYLFKWDVLQQWLSRNTAAAHARFETLVAEVMHAHQPLFT
jgi:hypothetical protein